MKKIKGTQFGYIGKTQNEKLDEMKKEALDRVARLDKMIEKLRKELDA